MVEHTPGPWTWEITQQPYLGSETREQTLAANAGRKPGDPIVIGDTEVVMALRDAGALSEPRPMLEPGKIVILDTNGDYVAGILSTLEEWDQAGRDARLIASAPDLLSALVFARDVVKDIDGLKISHGFWDYIDAAIAKAQGT